MYKDWYLYSGFGFTIVEFSMVQNISKNDKNNLILSQIDLIFVVAEYFKTDCRNRTDNGHCIDFVRIFQMGNAKWLDQEV